MGYVHAEIELSNPKEGNLGRLTTVALVDTGTLTLCIQESDLRSYSRHFGGYEQNVGIRLVEPVSQSQ